MFHIRRRLGPALHRSPSTALGVNPATGAGFTLIEVLLSIAILAALYLIVGNAIDIPAVLLGTHDSTRKHAVKQLENAMYQDLIAKWQLSADIPEGKANAKPICRKGVTQADCDAAGGVKLDDELIPTYLPDLPVDPKETNNKLTGYLIYKQNGRPRIKSAYLGTLPGG